MDPVRTWLARRLANLLKRAGVVVMLPQVAGDLPRIQVRLFSGELKDGVPVLQPYGFYGRVLPASSNGQAAETDLLSVLEDLHIALPPADRRFQITGLVDGEVCIATDEDEDAGLCRLHFKRGKLVELTCANVVVNATENAQVNAGANVSVTGGDDVEISAGSNVTINAGANAVINGEDLALGGVGGPRVARVGDLVNVGSGSSAGTWPIVSGSDKVSCA